jgi:hypothetical protein
MKRLVTTLAGTVLLAFCLALAAPATGAETLLALGTMVGVNDPFLSGSNPIRGVPGAGAPWVLEGVEGELQSDGTLRVDVFGLVLADDPRVAPERRLMNPSAEFRAVVSCLAVDELDPTMTATINLTTGPFPASVAGDATIEEKVDLPMPCFAPIVFVTSAAGNWFAVTGK